MTYRLGVDLGTTYSSAAVAAEGKARIVALGNRSAVMPSVVYARPDGELLVGERADRRGMAEPQRVAREFKRRMGDPNALDLGGVRRTADQLMAALLPMIVETTIEKEGGPPDRLALTHPGAHHLRQNLVHINHRSLLQLRAPHRAVAPISLVRQTSARLRSVNGNHRIRVWKITHGPHPRPRGRPAMTTKPQTTPRAADIMTAEPVCVELGMTLRQVARLFDEHEISGAPVVNGAGHLVGVVSRTDLVQRFMAGEDDRDPRLLAELFSDDFDDDGPLPDQSIAVDEFMTGEPVTAGLTTPLRELAARMLAARVHRIIIVDKDTTPVGIVTSLDLVKALAAL